MAKQTINAQTEANKSLVLALIQADLKNTKLVGGLDQLGLDSGKYYLDLGDVVFHLMGFEEVKEEIWEEYSDSLSRVLEVDIFKEPEKLEGMSMEIYSRLEKEIRKRV